MSTWGTRMSLNLDLGQVSDQCPLFPRQYLGLAVLAALPPTLATS